MALIHDFYLIRKEIEPTLFVRKYLIGGINIQDYVVDKVHIDDNIILYIIDTLRWIPTKNPGKKGLPPGEGLYYHGITLFDKDSSYKLMNVFSSWRSLFENGPAVIELPNKFAEDDEDQMLKFNKDELLIQLDKIVSLSEKIGEDTYYLYHCGI